MKKIILSIVVTASIAMAGSEFVETDYVNGNSEISALKAQMASMQDALNKLENKKVSENKIEMKAPKHKGVLVKSHVPIIKFSGTHYLGFVHSENGNNEDSNKFETRRNYFQAKAYFKDNPKSYMRVTMDTYDEKSSNPNGGQTTLREKYAYLYLDNVLPNTGIELGQAHRPWIDYEEHNSWNYRSISKVMVEAKYGANLTNSADRGINLKTKTPYFSSELGLFNGEGYHNEEDGRGLSGEWRLTGHLLETGKKKAKKSATYANVSFFGQQNRLSNKHGNEDLNWMGLHAVYNQPEFLASAQYINVSDGIATRKGNGYSINGEYRLAPKWNVLGRYDFFELDDNLGDKKRALAGITYKYNHNVEFIANYLKEGGSFVETGDKQDALMLTAQIEW